MVSICHYESPLGGVLLAADEIGLTGLWFDGQKYFARGLPADRVERETPALLEAKRWLDIYFSGKEPDFTPPLHPIGSAFRQSVWEILLQIPYGKTTTYGEIARQLSEKMGLSRMSAQAVGGAVEQRLGSADAGPSRCFWRKHPSDVRCSTAYASAASSQAAGRHRPAHGPES